MRNGISSQSESRASSLAYPNDRMLVRPRAPPATIARRLSELVPMNEQRRDGPEEDGGPQAKPGHHLRGQLSFYRTAT